MAAEDAHHERRQPSAACDASAQVARRPTVKNELHQKDAWQPLRRWTPARIGLGRAGGSLPTRELLDFRLAHARAVDAVHQPFDAEGFCQKLAGVAAGLQTLCLSSAVPDHATYLQRPDLGRTLSQSSREQLFSV